MTSFGPLKSAIFDREAKKQQYQAHILGLNAYDRHKKFLNDYVGFYGKDASPQERLPIRTDQDTLREGYRFIRTEEDDMDHSWEQRLVKRYYDKLFKEYCIADMSQYKTGKIGLRWRTEREVISGKGQFVCGNKHCTGKDGLASYEASVNFSYAEAGESKQALVKLVTCERCAKRLVYRKQKEKEQSEKREKEALRRKRERPESGDDMDHEYERSKEAKEAKWILAHRSRPVNGAHHAWLMLVSIKRRPRINKFRDMDIELTLQNHMCNPHFRGKKASNSTKDDKAEDDDNFDEFLTGMFL
ncbi:hypothetical protein RJ640_015429 [Escallonia rubra]|uniref:Protein FRA10AC1 n=1 Tax=Escallonia rubra TaxID=112253 RepID=A0AA88US58_9ASTE|nr:hypothetical protein RJ640_015429 [Escallonia rubra]